MTSYFLRIIYYQYNTGSMYVIGPNNGFRTLDIPCESLEAAERLRERLNRMPSHGTPGWLDKHYGIDGYVHRIDGIFKQTTERIA